LFLLCRYCSLVLLAIIYTLYIGDFTQEFCKAGVQPAYILFIPLHIFPQAVVAIRAYAFSGRQRWVLWSLGLCFAALCAVVIFAFHETSPLPSERYNYIQKTGCFPYYGDGTTARRLGMALFTITALDFYSLGIVVFYCFRGPLRRWELARHFAAQGLAAFAITSFSNLFTIFLFIARNKRATLVASLSIVICNIVACRIILKLKSGIGASYGRTTTYRSLTKLSTDYSEDEWVLEPEVKLPRTDS